MNARGLIVVWGSLSLFVVAIVAGYALAPAPWAKALMAVGMLGLAAWVCGILWLLNAMNTDI